MGMYGYLRRATADDVARMRADSKLVEEFLYGEAAYPPPKKSGGGLFGLLRRLSPFEVTTNEAPPTDDAPTRPLTFARPGPGEELDLEKAWHGLHFLFTGTDWDAELPGGFLLYGGEELGENDWGESAARLLSPDQVREIAAFLASLGPEEVARRFDPARMTELKIYPDVIWERDAAEQSRRWLVDDYEALRDFMADAAAAGDFVVVRVS